MAVSLSLRPITAIYPKLWYKIIPEPARFMTAAGFGNIIFFYIDAILYELIIHPLSLCTYNDLIQHKCPEWIQDDKSQINSVQKAAYRLFSLILPSKPILEKNKESISFFLSYLIQILAQHFLNAFFVYGLESISSKDRYVNTLMLTYSSYLVSLIGSTICNIALLRKGMSKNVAFWGTVFGFGMFNFFVLKFLIGDKKEGNGEVDSNSKDESNSTRRYGRSRRIANDVKNGAKKNDGWRRRTSATNNRRNMSSSNTRKLRGGASSVSQSILQKLVNGIISGKHEDDTQLMTFIKSVKSI